MGEPWQHVDRVVARRRDLDGVRSRRRRPAAARRRRHVAAHRPGPDRDVRAGDRGARVLRREQDPRAPLVGAYAGHSLGEYAALTAAGILDVEAATALVAARGAAMLAAARGRARHDGRGDRRAGRCGRGRARAARSRREPRVDRQLQRARPDRGRGRPRRHRGREGRGRGGRQGRRAPGRRRVPLAPHGGRRGPPPARACSRRRSRPEPARSWPTSTPRPHRGGPEWVDLLARQLTAPVRWTDSVRTLIDTCGCREFVEIGPGNTLSNLVKRIDRGTPTSRVTPA